MTKCLFRISLYIQAGDENNPEGLPAESTSVASLTADDTTIEGLSRAGLCDLFPQLGRMTMATKNIDPTWMKMLRLPGLHDLHVKALLPKRDACISDAYVPDFCDTLIKSFPRLVRLELTHVALGNQKSEVIVSKLQEHPSLQNLV